MIDTNQTKSEVYLSKRNLLTLLSKLERLERGEQTECTLIKNRQEGNVPYNQSMKSVKIIAVPDEVYYGAQNRSAGEVFHLDIPR